MKLDLNHFKRFEKQIILKKIGVVGQKKIFSSSVLIIGMGGSMLNLEDVIGVTAIFAGLTILLMVT